MTKERTLKKEADNIYNTRGRLLTGYDYRRQAWAIDGYYISCNHPGDMDCNCYGKIHKGEKTRGNLCTIKIIKW